MPKDPSFSVIRVNDTVTWVIKIPALDTNIALVSRLAYVCGALGYRALYTDMMQRCQVAKYLGAAYLRQTEAAAKTKVIEDAMWQEISESVDRE